MKSAKDSIYANPLGAIGAFRFDEKVVDVFPDMIERSVPGYHTILSAIGLLAKKFAQPDSHCYDLGCSLGGATLAMRDNLDTENCRIIAVDNSAAMINQLQAHLISSQSKISVEPVCSDIREIDIEKASIVVLNFTLQFIPLKDRLNLLNKIYYGLLPGGALILSEKLKYQDVQQNELHIEMHHLFKKAQGYSDLEISQKRTALENVLIPETLRQHKNRLHKTGFKSAEVWFQYFNFASIIALK